MATFFGEVVQQSSRAFWDDEDDYEEEFSDIFTNKIDLQVIHKTDSPLPTELDLFIVVQGPLTEGFVKTCLLKNPNLIAEIIEISQGGRETFFNQKKSTSSIYQLEKSIFLCICDSNLNKKYSHNFTEMISQWLKISKKVMVLTCAQRSSYLTDSDDLPISFMRELHTDNYTDKLHCNSLEQPNIIAGVSAGVLSWCQVFNIPAILYVVYTDSYVTDSITTQPLVKLFNELPQKLMATTKPIFNATFYHGPETGSNLYI